MNAYFRHNIYVSLDQIPILYKQKAILIDIRDHYTYQQSHLPGFINIPYSQMPTTLPKDKPLFLLCDTGQKSADLALKLNTLGYNTYSFLGGYQHLQTPYDPSLY